MLQKIKSTLSTVWDIVRLRTILGEPDSRSYWNNRAERYGRAAVLNLKHSAEKFSEVTTMQKELLFPLLRSQLNGSEKTILDYGCGPGRFTPDLAKILNGHATGLDICQSLIDIAPKAANVTYHTIDPSSLAAADRKYDAIWICLVLGGIEGAELQRVTKYLESSLKPSGLLFLVENTAARKNFKHWKYRTLHQYKSLLPSIGLKLIGGYLDCGEEISVMAGRLNEESQVGD